MSDWVDQLKEAARAALPPVEGEIALPGLREPVEVIRDTWGVPHIYAANLEDLFLAQGFVVASERLFQIDLALRMANGRLATMFADLMLPMDRFIRTVGWNRSGAKVAATYDELSQRMMSAFRAGARAWLEQMPAPPVEYQFLGLEPSLPEDDASWAACAVFMAWGLSGNWDNELLRVEIAERLGWETMLQLFPDLATVPPEVFAGSRDGRLSALELLRHAPAQPRGQGSNNWVVDGSRTATGKPLLANDPHLTVAMPSVWFEVHLSCPEYEASGVALPFSPGVVIGHTAHHAWGFTNVTGDVQDLYLERLNENGTHALNDGAWEPLAVHHEQIEVRGTGEPVALDVRETRHGPILDSYLLGLANPQVIEGAIKETYALRWVGSDRAIQPSSLVRMAQAASFDAFREAVRHWDCPGQNMIYADDGGNIGYQCTGLYPVRRKGDGTLPVPGWTSEHDWDGWVPFEELPWSVNPASGYLATANNRIHGDNYPHLIGHDFLPPFRARRIVQMLTAERTHSQETFARMQMDTRSIPAAEILPLLLEVEPTSDEQKEALAQLEEWDCDLTPDSAAAAIYQVWSKHIARATLLPKIGEELFDHYYGRREWTNAFQFQVLPNILASPTAKWFGSNGRAARDDVLRRALNAALDELTQRLGDDTAAWRWGALHTVTFAHPLAMVPDLADMFTGGVVETGGDEQTVMQGAFEPGEGYGAGVVPSWRQIVDLADVDASVGVHTTGQSGNPASPHWNDLVHLWSAGRYHPLPFTRAAVEAAAAGTLTLSPR